jgi:hypothetical protein
MTDSQTKYDDQLQEQLARANFILIIGAIVLLTGLLILANDAWWWRRTGVWTDISVSYLLSYYEIDLKPLSWESAERALEQILGLPVWWFLISAGALTVVAGWSRRARAKSEFRRLYQWREAERLARESADPL